MGKVKAKNKKIGACYSEGFPHMGLRVDVTAVPIQRGTDATITYAVSVWALSGGYATLVPTGEAMLPPEMVLGVKLKLWAEMKPW